MPRGRVAKDWPIEQIRQWVEGEKMTHAWVAEQLGCAAQTVGKLCAKHGIHTQRRGPRPGPGHPNWQGGRRIDRDGYVLVWVEGHPRARHRGHRARANGYVLEHRLVMEKHLGRYLTEHEVVHHRNGDKQDNRLSNLELFATNADHLRHELTGRCPDWSDDGKARIVEATRRAWADPEARAQRVQAMREGLAKSRQG